MTHQILLWINLLLVCGHESYHQLSWFGDAWE